MINALQNNGSTGVWDYSKSMYAGPLMHYNAMPTHYQPVQSPEWYYKTNYASHESMYPYTPTDIRQIGRSGYPLHM